MKAEDSRFLTEYKTRMKTQLMRMHPDWDEDKLDKKIGKILVRDLKNPEVIMDNNYIKKSQKSTLLSALDWAFDRNPIMAGNGTFYKQHSEIPNPNAEMVDGFLIDRKKLKAEMFKVGDESSRKYKDFDLKQVNKKKLANSYYGASGAKTSPFYSKWSAIATTSSAQAGISTTETTFEAFLVGNFVFIDFNECIEWLDCVVKENVELEDWIIRVDEETVFERISKKVLGITKKQEKSLKRLFDSFSEEELTRIYWKNNLIEFTRKHEKISKLHDKIFSSIIDYDEASCIDDIPEKFKDKFKDERDPVKAWNKFVSVNKFYDPNTVPDTILPYLEELKKWYMKYVYVQFVHCDRIYRLKNFRRKVVTVIDTDSNILSLDTWMNFCNEELMQGSYGRSFEDNTFVAVNAITYIITAVVTDILLYFGECSNVEESIRPRYNMKNEFYFAKLIIAKTKKRYLSRIVLREGNLLKKPKYDVKGFDFKKSGVSKPAQELFMSIIKDDLLDADTIDLKVIMHKLNSFKNEIIRSIKSGETTYLPIENAKELGAYDDPGQSMGVRGVLSWNICHPEKAIEFPAKLPSVKMLIEKEEDLLPLKETNPDIYKSIIDNVFHDTKKIFVRQKKNNKGQYENVCIGINVLSIPKGSTIPEWALDYIDYRTIVNNILAPFNSVLDIFNLPGIEEGKTGKKTTGISNIIRL